jgi:hypothetical protein
MVAGIGDAETAAEVDFGKDHTMLALHLRMQSQESARCHFEALGTEKRLASGLRAMGYNSWYAEWELKPRGLDHHQHQRRADRLRRADCRAQPKICCVALG